jgi:exosortase A
VTIAVPAEAFAPADDRVWARHALALGCVWTVLLAAFQRDVGDMVGIWWTSTTYGHCLFIPPVVAWLVWQRRRELAELTPVGWWPGLAIVAAGGFAWLLGQAGGVALARHLGLVVMLQGAAVAMLGPNVARALALPLGYALFAVPFGEELEPPLQDLAVAIVLPLLNLVGVPAQVDGVLIHAGRYWFEVAEACSGAKFVLAMLAFGVLVAGTSFRSWRRRAVFLAACVLVPVLANGVRAFGTIWAADLFSIEAATGVDHIVYGWVFFAIVMAGLIAAAWRWFDRSPDAPAFDPSRLQRLVSRALDLGSAALLVLATAAVLPLWDAVATGRADPLSKPIAMPEIPGWTRAPTSVRAPWRPNYPGADHQLLGRYADGRGHEVDLAVAVYAAQSEGRELVGFGLGVLRENDRWVRVADAAPIADGSAMRITAPGPVERTVATWYRVAAVTTADPARVKLETVRARLTGGDQAAVALHLSAEEPRAREAIDAFLRAAGPPERLASSMVRR